MAYFTTHRDEVYDFTVRKCGFFLSNKADGARTILATISGSMMGIAVIGAGRQYGLRLIGNFMRDRGNQITLGTFTLTLIYFLLILPVERTRMTPERTVRLRNLTRIYC